jgi:hypothetical protein
MMAVEIAPWNASWSGEDRYEVRPCRWAQGRPAIWQPHAPGTGRPQFAAPHMVRQRRSVSERRCTVCGEKTAPADRWHFDMRTVMSGHLVTTEAPVHRACADRAMQLCPVIRSKGLVPTPFPRGWVVLAAMIGGPHVERDFGLRIPEVAPVVGHLKFAWPMQQRMAR